MFNKSIAHKRIFTFLYQEKYNLLIYNELILLTGKEVRITAFN